MNDVHGLELGISDSSLAVLQVKKGIWKKEHWTLLGRERPRFQKMETFLAHLHFI